QRNLQRVEIAVAFVALQTIGTERRNRPVLCPWRSLKTIGCCLAEQAMALAADVTCLSHKASRQLLLNIEVPVFVICILAVVINLLRTEIWDAIRGVS